jgi:hypothetical protein
MSTPRIFWHLMRPVEAEYNAIPTAGEISCPGQDKCRNVFGSRSSTLELSPAHVNHPKQGSQGLWQESLIQPFAARLSFFTPQDPVYV